MSSVVSGTPPATPSEGFVGVVAALHGEARCLAPIAAHIGAQAHIPGLRIHVSGVGSDHAIRAARVLLKTGATALLSWGTCGALDPRLVAGDLILPQTVYDDSGTCLATDTAWRAHLVAALPQGLQPASQAPLLSGDRLLTTPADKAAGFKVAVAVDMESAALARVARAAGLPFMVVRVVVDSARQRLPQLALDTVDDIGRPHVGAFLAGALKRPWQLWELPVLGRDFRKATATLTAIAACTGTALAFGAAGRAS